MKKYLQAEGIILKKLLNQEKIYLQNYIIISSILLFIINLIVFV